MNSIKNDVDPNFKIEICVKMFTNLPKVEKTECGKYPRIFCGILSVHETLL